MLITTTNKVNGTFNLTWVWRSKDIAAHSRAEDSFTYKPSVCGLMFLVKDKL